MSAIRLRAATVLAAAAVLASCDDPTGAPDALRDCRREASDAVPAEVRLSVGEARALPDGAALCLVLPPGSGARYALAFLDTREIEAGRDAFPAPLEDYRVSVAEVSGDLRGDLRPAPSRAARSPLPPPPDLVLDVEVAGPRATSHGADGHPALRDRPWAEGEVFPLMDEQRGGEAHPARVLRVYDGYLVVARFEDEEMPTLERTLAQLDNAAPAVRDVALPLLRRTFTESLPVSSAGSGQLLLTIRPTLVNASGRAFGATLDDQVFGWISITANASNSARTWVSLSDLVVHEVAHTFQRRHMHLSRPAGAPFTPTGTTLWGVEGGAVLVQQEYVRRLAGVGLLDNYDWRAPGPSTPERRHAQISQAGTGEFTDGYGSSSSFLYDLVRRRVRAGEEPDAALADVARGAAEGWWGFVSETDRRRGLADRVRGALGGGWEPDEAMLVWTLSHAADDRTSSPVFQNGSFLNVWDVREGEFGWFPEARIEAGGGARVEIDRTYGSPGYLYLADAGGGGAYLLRTATPGVRWMIVRYA